MGPIPASGGGGGRNPNKHGMRLPVAVPASEGLRVGVLVREGRRSARGEDTHTEGNEEVRGEGGGKVVCGVCVWGGRGAGGVQPNRSQSVLKPTTPSLYSV